MKNPSDEVVRRMSEYFGVEETYWYEAEPTQKQEQEAESEKVIPNRINVNVTVKIDWGFNQLLRK